MRTPVKICCVQSLEELQIAVEAGADAIGLVGAMPSGPGAISDEIIDEIAAAVPPPISCLMLTAEQTAQTIAAHVRRTHASVVQIVSHLNPAESML